MKKISKRMLAVMLAAIMAIPTLFALPSTASAMPSPVTEELTHEYLCSKSSFVNMENMKVHYGVSWNDSENAAYFDGGSNAYIDLIDNPLSGITADTGFTLSVDVKRDNPGEYARILDFGDNTQKNYYAINAGSNNNVRRYCTFLKANSSELRTYANGSNSDDYHATRVYLARDSEGNAKNFLSEESDGTWHNIKVTLMKNGDYGLVYRYFDNQLYCVYVLSNYNDLISKFSTFSVFYLGKSEYSSDSYFKGYMKNVKIFKGVSKEKSRIAQWTFNNTLDEAGGGNTLSDMQHWGDTPENQNDHMYLRDGWLMGSAPSAMRDSANKKNWRLDFEFNMTDTGLGANRLEHLVGISDQTGLDVNYNGSKSFGMSTNGKIYFNTTDFADGAIADTGINLKPYTTDKDRFILSYDYHDGVMNVLLNYELKCSINVSANKSFFENINTITVGGRNAVGNRMDLWDLSVYSYQETGTLDDHLKARYFVENVLSDNVSGSYNLKMNGTGAEWVTVDEKQAAHFLGGNNGNSPNYLYLPREKTRTMLSNASVESGFSFSFMSKSVHSDSWQRIFELTNVDYAYSGGSANKYVMFTSQYDGSAHFRYGSSDGETITLNNRGGVTSWHVWTITVQEGCMIIYKDGVESFRGLDTKADIDWFREVLGRGQFLFGASSYSDNGFDGYIRDFRVYDIALSADQVSTVYNDTIDNRTVSGSTLNTYKTQLESACSAYVTKMNNMGSTYYTNTKAAYEAYVVANRYLDAINYGYLTEFNELNIKEAVDRLTRETNNIGTFSYKTGTYYPRWYYNDGMDQSPLNDSFTEYVTVYANVIYSTPVYTARLELGQSHSVLAKMHYPESIVWMYDGITNPCFPVGASVCRTNGGGSNRQIATLYPCVSTSDSNDNANVRLACRWRGKGSNSGDTDDYIWTMGNRGNQFGYNHDDYNSSGNLDNWSFKCWSSVLNYNGGALGENVGKEFSVPWFVYANAPGNDGPGYGENTGDKIRLVNYKIIRDNISTARTRVANISSSIADYKENEAIGIISAYGDATEFDPNSYFANGGNTATNYSRCTADLTNIKTELSNNTSATNSTIYNTLRNKLADARSYYTQGADTLKNTYTRSSVEAFMSSYYTAMNHMANLRFKPYNTSRAQEVYDDLNRDFAGLKTRASFSALDTAYTNAQNAFAALTSTDYTTSTYNAANTFLSTAANFPYHAKTDYERADMASDTYQSAIDTETSSLTNALSGLERRADFTDLDAAKQTIANFITTHATEYTTSSKSALTSKINSTSEFPLENNADRANTGVSQNDAIAAEKAKYDAINIYSELDPVANLVYFDAEYDKANTFLMELNNKAAIYTGESIQAVIDAVEAAAVSGEGHANKSASTIAHANSEARADYGAAVQTDANAFAADIKTAMDGLQTATDVTASGIDTSAYEAAVVKINNLDPDAYDVTSSVITARNNVNSIMGGKGATDTTSYTADGKTSNINVLNSSITIEGAENQADVDALITTTLTAINNSIKSYAITKHEGGSQDFSVSAKGGTYSDGRATYGTTIVAATNDNSEVAWYLEIQTGSMHKELAFQGYGKRLSTKVLGDTTIKAVKAVDGEKRVKIIRKYGDNAVTDKSPIQLVEYTTGDYTLPAAPAMANYTFYKYIYGENQYDAGQTITGITGDIEVYACYNEADGSEKYNVFAYDATGESVSIIDMKFSKPYNEKVTFHCDGAAGWIESIDGTNYRPFAIGEDVTFFVSENISLKAVDAETFAEYSLPAVNLRKSGVLDNAGKKVFNAQLVNNGKEIQEYGILIAAPYSPEGSTPIDINDLLPSMVIIENSGKHTGEDAYQILRAKSTKLVGAGQFTISVSSLPANYIYRGYAIYKDAKGNLQTVYSEAMR